MLNNNKSASICEANASIIKKSAKNEKARENLLPPGALSQHLLSKRVKSLLKLKNSFSKKSLIFEIPFLTLKSSNSVVFRWIAKVCVAYKLLSEVCCIKLKSGSKSYSACICMHLNLFLKMFNFNYEQWLIFFWATYLKN